ncbi:unnamed protein product [Rotaria magnacalcarata]
MEYISSLDTFIEPNKKKEFSSISTLVTSSHTIEIFLRSENIHRLVYNQSYFKNHFKNMEENALKNVKILTLGMPDLPTKVLDGVTIHCSNMENLEATLAKYRESTLSIVCKSDDLIGVDRLIMDNPIETLYVLIDEKDEDIKEWQNSFVFANIIEVHNEKQLMLRLCMKAMIYHYNQGLEHRRRKNNGLANLCFLDSLNALNYSNKFY